MRTECVHGNAPQKNRGRMPQAQVGGLVSFVNCPSLAIVYQRQIFSRVTDGRRWAIANAAALTVYTML